MQADPGPHCSQLLFKFVEPFPTYSKSAADDFENVYLKIWKISISVGIIIENKLITLWQKEKLLVLSNFSLCHDVFKCRLLQMRQNASIGGKGLTSSKFCLLHR